MAKMFYTLQETAEKLGVGEDEIKEMAKGGKLQQFRDRDKLMFKRDQVDSLASARADDDASETGISSGAIPLDETGLSTGEIPKGARSSGDQIDLAIDEDDLPGAKKSKNEDSRMATGISVFDAGEIDDADPHAQTIVKPVDDEEELALESVGSGSGLLDLTQESDDTSLGAELLDEIYPGGEGSDAKIESPGSSSGAFEPASAAFGSGSSGLEYQAGGGGAPVYVEVVEEPDPAGNGLGIGMFAVALVVLIAAMLVAVGAVNGTHLDITKTIAGPGGDEDKTLMYYFIGSLVAAILFGVIGFFIGKSKKNAA
ncbi:MAG: helix-turn-helix domain-containing protein [Phycisphaeraceae bacterium]